MPHYCSSTLIAGLPIRAIGNLAPRLTRLQTQLGKGMVARRAYSPVSQQSLRTLASVICLRDLAGLSGV